MQHIQGHIDSSKQQNIDLSDLTQCKQCYKQFDTPFEMQTHMEKVGIALDKALFSTKKCIFLISRQKHMLWVLIRSALARRF